MKALVKRVFSLVLCACFVLGGVPFTSNAAQAERASYSGEALDIARGNITIGSTTITHGETVYNYAGTVEVKITGSTTENSVLVESGVAADIVLSDVVIDLSESSTEYMAAVEIADDSTGDVTIILEGDNVLKGSMYAAALQKNGNSDVVGTLTIQGDGSLEAVGGSSAAAIGADDMSSAANVCIAGGVITTSATDGDGIGTGVYAGTFSNLVIIGGSLKADFRVDAKNDEGEYVMPLTIQTDGVSNVTINQKKYPQKHGDENMIYTYLSVDDVHHVEIGEEENDYFFYGVVGEFVKHAKAPECVTATYGDKLSDVVLSVVNGGIWKWRNASLSVGEVGTSNFTAQFSPSSPVTHYSDPVQVQVTVEPKPITITSADIEVRSYDGTVGAEVNSVTFDGNLEDFTYGVDYVATAEFADANAGADKDVTVTVELLNGNYALIDNIFETKATMDKSLYYDIDAFDVVLTYGDVDGKVTVSSVSGGKPSFVVVEGKEVISVDETTGKITILKAGEAKVKISVEATQNYYASSKTVSVMVNKKPILPPVVNENNEFTYTGIAQTYVLAASNDYVILNTTQTAVGSYEAVVTLRDAENTRWASNLPEYMYIIKKAPVTITANDKTMIDDEDYPKYDYTVEGLVNGERLPFEPTIVCACDKTPGEHDIVIAGPKETGSYIYTYVNGTLTVTVRETQTITASDIELTYGNTDEKVSASTDGNGSLKYEVTEGKDVISVDETTGKITVLKTGSAQIKITAYGTYEYYEASKTISVTVNKKSITPPEVNENNEFTYTGFPQSYILAESDEYTITNATQTEVGSYEAVVTLKDTENTRWASNLPEYIYIIKKASVTITANDAYAKAGGSEPEYDYTVKGLLNGEELDFVPTISCATDLTQSAVIEITGPAENAHYIFTYVNGTLTVGEKLSQNIVVTDMELTYGDAGAKIEAATEGDGILGYEVIEGEGVVAVNQTTGALVILGAGTATIKVSATETDDYYLGSRNIHIKVNKAKNAPNMPDTKMSVACGTAYVGAVELPAGWAWPEMAEDDALVAGAEIMNVAEYVGADVGNYENECVQIMIYRAAHEESEVLFDAQGDLVPTCEEGGIGHVNCTVCTQTVKTQVSVDAIGHNYKALFVWAADGKTCMVKLTCTRDALHTQTKNCNVTSKVKTVATCKSSGVTTYTATYESYASVKDMTDIPKLTTHTWGSGVITKNPTATAKGEKTFTCDVCGVTKAEETAALPLPGKGKNIKSTDNKAVYTVTKQGKEVTYKAPVNKKWKKVVIPATINVDGVTYKVTGIAKKAFANNKKITSIVIGKNVKTIGDEAFSKCTALKTVTIPASVNRIGKKAFYNCKVLKTITVKTTKLTAKNVGANAWKGVGSKYYSKVTIKVPKKKLSAYKKLFKNKGLSPKVKVKK